MIDSAIRPPLSGSGNEIARDETFLEIGMIGKEIEFICLSVYIYVASLLQLCANLIKIFDKIFIESEEIGEFN